MVDSQGSRTMENITEVECMPDGGGDLSCSVKPEKGLGTRFSSIESVNLDSSPVKEQKLTRTTSTISFDEPHTCKVTIGSDNNLLECRPQD